MTAPEAPLPDMAHQNFTALALQAEVHSVIGILQRYSHARAKRAQLDTQSKDRSARKSWWRVGRWMTLVLLVYPLVPLVPGGWQPWFLLFLPVALFLLLMREIHQQGQEFGLDFLPDLKELTDFEWPYLQELMHCSTASLTYVSKQLKSAERNIWERIALVVGSNRGNGLLGLGVATIGWVNLARYLQEREVQVPFIGWPITTEAVVTLLACSYLFFALLVWAGSKSVIMTNSEELLTRVLALKELEEDQ